MKKKLLVYSIMVLTLSLLFTSIAVAVCPPGKVLVTIVNPAGKAIEICVPEQVVDNIGGPGDVIVPAICPCFTQEDVEFLSQEEDIFCRLFKGNTKYTNEDCIYIECVDLGSGNMRFFALEGPQDFETSGVCIISGFYFHVNNACYSKVSDEQIINEQEGDACVAILKIFVQ
jgi:hypothetical protein